jgi:hypothetical protein
MTWPSSHDQRSHPGPMIRSICFILFCTSPSTAAPRLLHASRPLASDPAALAPRRGRAAWSQGCLPVTLPRWRHGEAGQRADHTQAGRPLSQATRTRLRAPEARVSGGALRVAISDAVPIWAIQVSEPATSATWTFGAFMAATKKAGVHDEGRVVQGESSTRRLHSRPQWHSESRPAGPGSCPPPTQLQVEVY